MLVPGDPLPLLLLTRAAEAPRAGEYRHDPPAAAREAHASAHGDEVGPRATADGVEASGGAACEVEARHGVAAVVPLHVRRLLRAVVAV